MFQCRLPALDDAVRGNAGLDLLPQDRATGQTIEVRGDPSKVFRVSLPYYTQELNRRGGGVIRGTVGYLQPDTGHRGIGILGITGLSRRELDSGKSHTRRSGCPDRCQHAACVDPGSAHLLERSIRPPPNRQIGPLEEAGAWVVKQTFQ